MSAARGPEILKPHWAEIARHSADARSAERVTAHYAIETALASRLMQAPKADRLRLYSELYGELFASLPDHPQNTRTDTEQPLIDRQVSMLTALMPRRARYAEIGAGDARVARALCEVCDTCTAIDVSDAVLPDGPKPDNFRFQLIDGLNLPFPDASFDFVYSNQLMEHLHPDDAVVQLREINRVLAPGGAYLCITPNAVTGPHDISMYVDETPTGFHLKEYTYGELTGVFAAAGFSSLRIVLRKGSRQAVLPAGLGVALERLVGGRREGRRTPILNRFVRNLMGICLLGRKDDHDRASTQIDARQVLSSD